MFSLSTKGAQGVTSDSHAGDVVQPPAIFAATRDASTDAIVHSVPEVLADAQAADQVHAWPWAFHAGVDIFG
jgi:hypothetical protein